MTKARSIANTTLVLGSTTLSLGNTFTSISGLTLSSPTISGGTHTALTSLSIRDTSAAFDVTLAATSSTTLTAGRTLTIDMVNAARTIKLAGNLDIAGTVTHAGAFTQTFTATGNTSITLPTTGTLLTTTGSGSSLTFGTGSLSLAGNLTTSGAFGITLTATGTTSVTLPTSGTLITGSSPTLTTPTIDTINASTATAAVSLYPTSTSATIALGTLIGSTAATGTINIATNAGIAGGTKAINLGTGATAGTTTITIGSAVGSTTNILGTAQVGGNAIITAASSFNLGTTSIALNRASASQTLTGISIDGNAGTVTNGVYTNINNTISGIVTLSGGDTNNSSIKLAGYNQRGGAGYHGFLETTNTFGTATNPNKYFRINSTGALEIVNSGYSATILQLTDAGLLTTGHINLSSTTVPANGIYQPASNTVGISSNTTQRMTFDANGSINLFGQMLESATVSATAAATTVTYDVMTNKNVLYYTTNATADWTLNVRGNASTTLNTLMTTGQSLTVVFMNTNGATAYRATAFQIDGVSVTPKWFGGSAPTAGNINSVDIYTYNIIKTGASAYTVFASINKFA